MTCLVWYYRERQRRVYCFVYLQRTGPNYVRKPYLGSFYPLIHFLWENRNVPVFFLVFSVTLKIPWKVTQSCYRILIRRTPWSVRAAGHLVPGAAPQLGHVHFVQHSGVGWVHPSSKRRKTKMSTSPSGTLRNTLPGMQPHKHVKKLFSFDS